MTKEQMQRKRAFDTRKGIYNRRSVKQALQAKVRDILFAAPFAAIGIAFFVGWLMREVSIKVKDGKAYVLSAPDDVMVTISDHDTSTEIVISKLKTLRSSHGSKG